MKRLKKTPGLFNVHALRAEIYLEHGNMTVAHEEIRKLEQIVYRGGRTERLSNLRPFLDIEISYLTAIGDFAAARRIYDRKNVYSVDEREGGLKRIDMEQ